MDLFRVDVTPRGKGYFAKSTHPQIGAVGASPVEAAENARLMARATFANKAGPAMLLVRIHEPGLETIVMQPIDEIVSLNSEEKKSSWRYSASVPNAGTKAIAE